MGSSVDLLAGMPAVAVRYRAPAPDLRRFVSAYYLFAADMPHIRDLLRADQAQLRFMLAGRGGYGFADGGSALAPDVTLLGPSMGATRFDLSGPALVLGVGLRAAGWAALIGDDASLYADRLTDGAAVLGAVARDALEELRNTPVPARMAEILENMLRTLLLRRPTAPGWFAEIADNWLTACDNPQVDRLVADAELSSRQVERITRRIYGAPPKLLARKYRALRVVAKLNERGPDALPDLADGFYDQSHFIREFKQFTGFTPRQFIRNPTPLTVLTLQRNALPGQPALVATS